MAILAFLLPLFAAMIVLATFGVDVAAVAIEHRPLRIWYWIVLLTLMFGFVAASARSLATVE